MAEGELVNIVEAILFVSGEPVSLKQLEEAVASTPSDIGKALDQLKVSLSKRGLRLAKAHGYYQLITDPMAAQAIERFLGAQAKIELSKPAAETLAIIAYEQPVTKMQIEEIRGVASDQTIKNLLIRGLIIESGQQASPGRPTLYSTSHSFLQHLGLSDASDLKPLKNFKKTHDRTQPAIESAGFGHEFS